MYATHCSITKGNAMTDDSLPDLGELERAIMQLSWSAAE